MNQLNGKIVRIDKTTNSLFKLYIKPDYEIPDFKPGQYVAIGLPEEDGKILKRAYSIASSPSEKQHIELYVATVLDGALTPRLRNLRDGDDIFINKKLTGTFTLEAASTKNIICIATGTGLAPYISMLRNGISEYDSFTLIHGVRYNEDVKAYHTELCTYAQELPNFRYIVSISREEPTTDTAKGPSKVLCGRVRTELIENILEDACVYICGNPALIEDFTIFLANRGFSEQSKRNPTGRLILESYW